MKTHHTLNIAFIRWDQMTGIQKAITAAGSQKNLAQQLGCTQQAVSEWESRGYVPVARIVEIEAEFGIDRRELIDPRLRDLLERD